jgi:hypothetical protein
VCQSHLIGVIRTLQNPRRTRVQHVSVSDTLGTLLHACPHCIGREKNIYLFKKVSSDYKYVFKDFDSCYLC